MKPRVIVPKIYDEPIERLKEYCDVTVVENYSEETFYDQLEHADGIIAFGLKVDKQLLERAPNLKIVANIGVGYDNLDIEELNRQGIMATNTPDVVTDTTADAAMALLLATARRIPQLDHYVKSRKWEKQIIDDELYGIDIYEGNLGIIGMGRVGTAIAKRAHFGFNMNILYHNRKPNQEVEKMLDCNYVSLDELLRESDFICLTTPLNAETENMIGAREFKLMKETAIFLNISRGGTVVEEDLIEALRTNQIAAAGLDVYKKEQIEKDNPLLGLPNTVTLPHVGGATIKTRLRMMNVAVDNLLAGLQGEKPKNLIII